MDWSNERYVRLYVRDTAEWLCMSWQARAFWPLLLRKMDRSGVIQTKLGVRGLAALTGFPLEHAEVGIVDLLLDGCLREHAFGYLAQNFMEAQEAISSDAQRQRESRLRRRLVTNRDTESRNVSNSHAVSRDVTNGHAVSRDVTPSLAEPSGPSLTLPIGAETETGNQTRAIPATPASVLSSTNGSKIGTVPVGESGWARRQSWWQAMLDADARIKASGIEPNAPSLPKTLAGEHERNVLAVERTLRDGGFSPEEVDEKMRHIVAVREAEAKRPGGPGRRYFKPSVIWDPRNALRAADTSLEEAAAPVIELVRTGERNGAAPAKDPRFGRLNTDDKTAANYGKGEQKF